MWGGELDEPLPPSTARIDTLHGPHHTGKKKRKKNKGGKAHLPISHAGGGSRAERWRGIKAGSTEKGGWLNSEKMI